MYLVADNNVKCETVAATRDRRVADFMIHHSRSISSETVLALILYVDYMICGMLE